MAWQRIMASPKEGPVFSPTSHTAPSSAPIPSMSSISSLRAMTMPSAGSVELAVALPPSAPHRTYRLSVTITAAATLSVIMQV